MKKFFRQKNKGFTLVETLVSISIFTMSILGLLVILSGSINDTGYAKKKMVASYLAQEGIEYVRNLRDNAVLYDATSPQAGWDSFKNAPLTQIPPFDSSFTRLVSITPLVSTDEVKITSTVTWTQGSGSFNVVFTENLFNWVE